MSCCKNKDCTNDTDIIIDQIIDNWRDKPGCLIQVLQEVQTSKGYLSEESIKQIAKGLNLSKANVFGVATFYTQFHLKKRGKYIIKVCTGTACHVKGAQQILDYLRDELLLIPGATTTDKLFSLETVACVGSCVLAPVVLINERTLGKVTVKSFKNEIALYKNNHDVIKIGESHE